MNILHLTHTDINSDSRILQEINSIARSNSIYHISGFSIIENKGICYTNADLKWVYKNKDLCEGLL